MKTKSKRFLNLATLCLALLGTTLLMAHPVKAEAIPTTREVQQSDESTEDSDIRKQYMTMFGLTDLNGHQDRFKGYLDGYKEGLQGSNRPERGEIKVPSGFTGIADSDYRDGYEQGFGEGQHKRHPLETEAEGDSQEHEGRQDSVGSSSQQEDTEEDTDMISPVIQTVIQTVFDVFSSFLNWLEAAI
ncbi:hypothetical protein [Streptococcus pyogenes]|uniref:hypothetical protein n=1 Tax=Streptococcus pyogenes TaxID=1314 RepID=UPI0010EF4A5B|nr:hypothetical protein [Streptococcus pyogenes]VGQ50189.1 hypothetical membrane associated protein [Streptococcus pyogenes]VGQ72713.1 hypothetical membrane associated protein [Streptococcus pyogenes]VGU91688.1 Uncharacterised protein [Streptococcus pyogenes]VGU96877.1 Uncharacterised protein [Streptococcus pyogenes]VGV27679.1 Uncharacterised protein [Streptococcus pyogenes]